MIRVATPDDVPILGRLENRCFESDRLSERSFRHLIGVPSAQLLVAEDGGLLTGYVLVLFRRKTSMARMYSLAVEPSLQGRGIGKALIEAAEKDALGKGVVSMRLEVRMDNAGAIALYRKLGYHDFGVLPDYYDDHMDALRMEKELAPHLAANLTPVPFYPQSLEFTCGPACLMMAMKTVDRSLRLDRMLELRIWREATTIFMTSGHGGCDPYGLALSAWQRGYAVELFVRYDVEMFASSVRNAEKREVIRTVTRDFMREAKKAGIPVHSRMLSLGEMEHRFNAGEIPVVLISAYRLTGDKSQHWVVVVGMDEQFVYINEPYVDVEEGRSDTDCIGIPVPREEFERMTRYGKSRQYATVLIAKR